MRVALAFALALLAPHAITAQVTAVDRTAMTHDLLRLRDVNGREFLDIVAALDGGDSIIDFLDDPVPEGAPSARLMQSAIRTLQEEPATNFGGGANAFASIALRGAAGGSVSAGLPATGVVLRATADFLAGRVKDELAIEYVTELSALVNGPVVRHLALDSRRALGLVQETDYRLVLPLLRESLVRDFRALPERLTTSTTYDSAAGKPDRELLSAAAVSVALARDLLEGGDVLDVLGGLERLEPDEGEVISPSARVLTDDTIRTVLVVTGMFAREYEHHGAAIDSVLSVTAQSPAYFLAFLASDVLRDSARLPGIENRAATAQALFSTAEEIASTFDAWHRLRRMAELADESDVHRMVGEYVKVLESATALLETHAALLDMGITHELEITTRVARATAEAYAQWAAGNYPGVVAAVLAMAELAGVDSLVLGPPVERFFVFAASFTAASTDEQMVAVLESAALPPAGYRTKRRSAAFGITAYGGAAAFNEQIDDGGTALAGGPSFPIGAEFSFPVGGERWGSSVSLFFSVLDIGNLISFRESEGTPEPELEQVLAPGIGFQLGLGRSNPWSLGFLAQRVPDLRERASGAEDVVRFGVFLGIDMPLFRMWSR